MGDYNKNNVIEHMYIEEGMTIAEIADETGYTKQMVKNIISRIGVRKDPSAKKDQKDHRKKVKRPLSDYTYEKINDDMYIRDDGVAFRKMSRDELMDAFKNNFKL